MNDAERLGKLLLLLSSDQPGEVFNAARAIERTLRATGKDWYDLARRLSVPAKKHTGEQPSRHDSNNNWRIMHKYCGTHVSTLRPREREFIESLGDWRGDLTEKQHVWLVSIYQRLSRANK
jgi:hypothetical protein